MQDACCIPGAEPYKVGVLPNKGNKEKFRAGLHCCEFAIKPPEVLALSEGRCFVLHDAAAFPFAGPVPVPVCALYGLRCLPGPIATCGAPPEPAASLLQVTVEEKKSDGAGGPPASEMER